jgi:uncharacterized membrane protein YfcA
VSLFLYPTLVAVGALSGFAAGFLGVGGGVVLFPLLFYVPPLLGFERLEAGTVAALVTAQVFFASGVGGVAHWRGGRVHTRLATVGGASSAVGSFAGAIATPWVSERFLLFLFGIVSLAAVLIMLLPEAFAEEPRSSASVDFPVLPLSVFSFATGAAVGFLGAANFLFVPMLVYAMKIPVRIAIGTTLIIALANTAAGFVGRLATGQIPLLLAAAVVAGASLGALAGERCHARVSLRVLRYTYATVVGAVTIRVWLTLLG